VDVETASAQLAHALEIGESVDLDGVVAVTTAIERLTALCDKGMNPGTPWWVFRDAVRAILEKDS
jgi:hypothetical protein